MMAGLAAEYGEEKTVMIDAMQKGLHDFFISSGFGRSTVNPPRLKKPGLFSALGKPFNRT